MACSKNKTDQRQFSKKFFIFVTFPGLIFFGGCGKKNDAHTAINKNAPVVVTKSIENTTAKPAKILFLGDMMFDRYIRLAAERRGKDYNYIISEVKNTLSQFDVAVGNLEGPITNGRSVSVGTAMAEKNNFLFTFDPKIANTLSLNNIRIVNLGNNHILNRGENGILETKKFLREAGIEYFGNTGREDNFLVKRIGQANVGFVGYNYAAARSFEKTMEHIRNIGSRADIIVVCPHWGEEYKTGGPGQDIQSLAYKFVDAGADLIIGTHPHVVQTSEIYKGKKIYYSLGNFIFDQYFQKETMEGLGVAVTIQPDLSIEFDEIEFIMTKTGRTEMRKK